MDMFTVGIHFMSIHDGSGGGWGRCSSSRTWTWSCQKWSSALTEEESMSLQDDSRPRRQQGKKVHLKRCWEISVRGKAGGPSVSAPLDSKRPGQGAGVEKYPLMLYT